MSDEPFPGSQLAELVATHVDVPADLLCLTRCLTGKFNTTYFVEGGM
jgi:hypothetical protein